MKVQKTRVAKNGSHRPTLGRPTRPNATAAISRAANLLRRNVSMETLKPLYKKITKPSVAVKEECPQSQCTVNDVQAFHSRPMCQDFKLMAEMTLASSESNDRDPSLNDKQMTANTEEGERAAGHLEQAPEKVVQASNEVTQVRVQTTSSEANKADGEPTMLSPAYYDEQCLQCPPLSVLLTALLEVLSNATSPSRHSHSAPVSPAMGSHATDAQRLRLRGNIASVNSPSIIPGAKNPDGTPRANPFHELMPAVPIWHRNMPPYFPFGETPFMEKVMSDQINRDLKNSDKQPECKKVRLDASGGAPRPSNAMSPTVQTTTLTQQALPRPVPNGPRKTHIFRTPWRLPRLSTHVLEVLLADPESTDLSQTSGPGSKCPAPPKRDRRSEGWDLRIEQRLDQMRLRRPDACGDIGVI
nr:hypothetical protein CFP56_09109 [Quercus suber]